MSSGAARPSRRNTAVSGGNPSSAKRFRRKIPLHAAVSASRNPHSAAPIRRATVLPRSLTCRRHCGFGMERRATRFLRLNSGFPSALIDDADAHLGAPPLRVDDGDAGKALAVGLPDAEPRALERRPIDDPGERLGSTLWLERQ